MTVRSLINGQPGASLPVLDRGFTYGDGLFETIRFEGTHAPLWARHMHRLREGCARLSLPAPDAAMLLDESLRATAGMRTAVVRLTLTRGDGERGYAVPQASSVRRAVTAFDPPDVRGELYRHGLALRLCALRLAAQPALAGMKHLNRLEQVLARAEWNDPSFDEGLLCDAGGLVISAIAANLFAVIDGALVTPSLHNCGVAGVARAEVLAACTDSEVRELPLADLLTAGEIFLTSSVRGILPVQSIDARIFAPGPRVRDLQRHWRTLGFNLEHA